MTGVQTCALPISKTKKEKPSRFRLIIFNEENELLNVKHRLLNPKNPKDKYRPETHGLGAFPPLLAIPSMGYDGELVIVVEGEIKAMVTWAHLPAFDFQVIGVRRNPLDGRNRLKVKGKDPNYEYRIVNITEDRVDDMLERGWEFETSENVSIGGSRVDNNSRLGKVHEISVGLGTKAVLMKIKRDWYNEDQSVKQEYVEQTEKAMRPDPNEGGYGKVELKR